MTARDISALKAESASLFPDNVSQEITPARKRSYDVDVADSALNVAETADQEVQSKVNFVGGIEGNGVPIQSPENVTVINELADFPAPVGGVIELSGGTARAYEIASKTIDIGSNVFSVSGAAVTVKGLHRVASQIATTSSNPMFSMTGGSLYIESCGINCANGNVLNITGGDVFVLDLCTVYNCISLGNVSDVFIVSFRTATVLSTQTSGLTFGGALNQLNMSNCLAGNFVDGAGFGWNGTLLNFGTSVIGSINIQSGNRFYSEAGNTIISGASNGTDNLTPTGLGAISGNSFLGEGTYLNNWSEQDLRFDYLGNHGLEESMADAWITSTDNALITDIIAVNTPVRANAVYTEESANRFTTDSTGRCTYVGVDDIAGVPINLSCSLEPTSNNRQMAVYIAKGNDGTGIIPSYPVAIINNTKQSVRTDNGDATSAPTLAQVSLTKGDFFEIWIENQTNSDDIYIRNPKLIIN